MTLFWHRPDQQWPAKGPGCSCQVKGSAHLAGNVVPCRGLSRLARHMAGVDVVAAALLAAVGDSHPGAVTGQHIHIPAHELDCEQWGSIFSVHNSGPSRVHASESHATGHLKAFRAELPGSQAPPLADCTLPMWQMARHVPVEGSMVGQLSHSAG